MLHVLHPNLAPTQIVDLIAYFTQIVDLGKRSIDDLGDKVP